MSFLSDLSMLFTNLLNFVEFGLASSTTKGHLECLICKMCPTVLLHSCPHLTSVCLSGLAASLSLSSVSWTSTFMSLRSFYQSGLLSSFLRTHFNSCHFRVIVFSLLRVHLFCSIRIWFNIFSPVGQGIELKL